MDKEESLRRLKRIQELKAADSTLTSQKALEMIRKEEERGEKREEAQYKRTEKREEREEEQEEEGEEREESREKSSAAREGKFLSSLYSGGKTVGKKAAGTFGDYGIVVAVLGLFTFLADLTGSPALFVILETVLLFTTVWFIFEKRGLVFVLCFWIWYFLIGGAFTTDPQVIFSMLLFWFVIGAVVRALVSKFAVKEGFFYGGGMEIKGLIPLIFLFLDMGAAEYVIKAINGLSFLNLSLDIGGTTLEKILIFTPWWTILGIMSVKKQNFFVSLLKIGCVIYIMSILLAGIAPEAYQSYQSNLPGPTELLEAKKEFREQAGSQINPARAFWNQISCSLSEPTNAAECLLKKEEEAVIKAVCEKEKGFTPGSALYKDCEQQELLKKRNPSFQVFGAVDRTIKEPTTAKVVLDVKSFPGYSNQNLPFPANIEIKNPRRQKIILEATCSFDGKDGAEDVAGVVPQRTSDNQPFLISDTLFKDTFPCSPEESKLLEGRYILQFNLTLKNLNTTSRLQRAFIGDKTEREKERLNKEEISRVIKQSGSLAPADFAWLSFDIGHALGEVMIENKPYRKIFVRSKIENKGKGELVKINKYSIDLEELGFAVDETGTGEAAFGCASYDRAFVPQISEQKEQSIALTFCEIKDDYPQELKNPEDWIPVEFLGQLQYDYRITAKTEIKIEKPPERLG